MFFIGTALSFLLLTLAGHWAEKQDYLRDFHRFHRRISLESYFYPPSSLFEKTALGASRPEDTLVIVGGSSVFNGVSQPVEELWSDELQKHLGEGYRVLNFALRGGYPTDAGAVAAEMLRKQGRKVIYVADLAPGVLGEPDGRDIYRYIFWDACYAGKLSPFPARENYLALRLLPEKEEEAGREMKKAVQLNRIFHSIDLWGYITYSFFSTIWSQASRPFFLPRHFFKDKERPAEPLETRYLSNFEGEMKIVRGPILQFVTEKTTQGWSINPKFGEIFRGQADPAFDPAIRSSVILVTTGPSPHYLRHLNAEESEKLAALYAHQQAVQKKAGFESINATGKLDDEDFSDRCHLTSSGGKKIAAMVAEKIRAMERKNPQN